MKLLANVNGRILREDEAVISVFDHGFLYGEGVYEVVRTYGQRPFLLDRHLQRMHRSAGHINLQLPFTDQQVRARIVETIEAFMAALSGQPAPEFYVRFILTRGVGELNYNPASCPNPSLVILVKPLHPQPEIHRRGVRVSLVSVVRNHPGTVNPLIKSNNLLNNALAMQEAMRKGSFEGLMRNYRGELAEGALSNVFIVKSGRALTPPLDAGLLPGITRGFLLEIGPGAGVPVEEHVLYERDLYEADEVFLSTTTLEVVPVVQADEHTIGTGTPGPITLGLLKAFRHKAAELTGK